jgi:hypothetical protein
VEALWVHQLGSRHLQHKQLKKDANELVVAGTSNTGTRDVAYVDIAGLDDDEDIQEEMTRT